MNKPLKKLKKSKYSILSALALLLMFLLGAQACNMLDAGLGEKVDIVGPNVLIVSPDYMENVQQDFTISGTASDNTAVTSLIITIRGYTRTWKYTAGAWSWAENSEGPWNIISSGTWLENNRTIVWSVPVNLPIDSSGEFVFEVKASDAYNNVTASSADLRTVVFDKIAPVLTVTNPVLKAERLSGTGTDLFADYDLNTLEYLGTILNGDILISGIQDENSKLDNLVVEISDASGTHTWTNTLTENLRNWKVTVPASALATAGFTGKQVLQIITKSTDAAGNTSTKSNGWFCYWNEANIPWVAFELPTLLSNAGDYKIYPGYAIQGQAFDDDGIDHIVLNLFEGTTLVQSKTIDLDGAEPLVSSWSINVPNAASIYSLQCQAFDADNTPSLEMTGYFTVEDVTIPDLTQTSPSATTALFGDALGNVNFAGLVSDNSGVVSLKLAWLKNAADKLLYLEKDYSAWASDSTDAHGNKVWTVSLGSESTNSNNRKERNFLKTINLFSDLGIASGTTLGSFNFVLRTMDSEGKVRMSTFTSAGDINPPNILVQTVHVKSANGLTIMPSTIIDTLVLPQIMTGETVALSGTWSDDSTNQWSDKSRIGPASLVWNGVNFPLTLLANGTWVSDYKAAPGGALASLSVSLSDLAGNQGVDSATFLVETDSPELLRIASTNQDGSYKAGQTITINLEFNKAITFNGGTPSLSLNTGRTANYISGNNSSRLVFTYLIQAGDTQVDLNVNSLNLNGATVRDQAGTDTLLTLPTGVNSLSGSRNLVIDTTAPSITAITVSNNAGSYKAGTSIVLTMTMSEGIVLSGSPSLILNNGVTIPMSSRLGANSLQFVYNVLSGHDTSELKVSSIASTGVTLSDAAGNTAVLTIPSAGSLGKVLQIDTIKPASPTVVGLPGNTVYSAPSFSLGNTELNARVEYSVDNGSTWTVGTGTTLTVNGDYTICARQSDLAGNLSDTSTAVHQVIDIGALLSSISSSSSDGNYKTGDEITILLNLRKPLIKGSGTGPSLTLNTSPIRSASYISGSGTKIWTFKYTVGAGDATFSNLDVNALVLGTAVISDVTGSNVGALIELPASGNDATLAEQKNIRVISGLPSVTGVTLSGNILELTFNRLIYKNGGSVTIAQKATNYRVPVVMAKDRFDEVYNAAEPSDRIILTSSYTWGTNGALANGSPDLDGKYVLNFNLDSNDPSLVNAFRRIGAHIVQIPVASSNVQVLGQTLRLSLTGSYSLPVAGATYDITILDNLVLDALGQANAADSSYTVALPGVETPIIRIEKRSETLSRTGLGAPVTASQPLSVQVKMETITPGASVYYTSTSLNYAKVGIDPALSKTTAINGTPLGAQANAALPAIPTIASTLYTAPFAIGDTTNPTATPLTQPLGQKFRIRAVAIKAGLSSNLAAESAYRSVLRFYNDRAYAMPNYAGSALTGDVPAGSNDTSNVTSPEQLWVRGGDSISGSTLTPGFPLAWDPTVLSGVRLMSRANGTDPASATVWYWVTWQLNAPAYVTLLWGTTPYNASEATHLSEAAKGPWRWGWLKNGYTPFKDFYVVYPGECRELVTAGWGTINNVGRGDIMFCVNGDGGESLRPGVNP